MVQYLITNTANTPWIMQPITFAPIPNYKEPSVPSVQSAKELVKIWEAPNTGLIALAHEFKDGTIQYHNNIPCHRRFNRKDFPGQKREDFCGAYVKLSYLAPGGYNMSGSGYETPNAEYDQKAEAWYDFITSKEGPWRNIPCKILKDSKGKYRALHIPNIDKQEMQPWLNLCFSTRIAPQRANAVRLWYDLTFKHGFHPTEALFIMSGLMYNDDQKTIQLNPINYDWLFKGYDHSRVSFYNLWHAKPNIVCSGTLNTTEGDNKGSSGEVELYGAPNDIWIEKDKKRAKATDFRKNLTKSEKYKGCFPKTFKMWNAGKLTFEDGVPDNVIELLKEERKKWPR